jgi:hypothetical protein
MEALLRVVAMLWSIVAATFQMDPSRRARECDTPPAPQALPRRTRDIFKETPQAADSSQSIEALVTEGCAKVLADEVPSSPWALGPR